MAVVTGQQAGAFGGPLYTMLKAVTAIQLARRIQREHGVPAVAVFWVDSEDHDWEEIRTATTLDRDLNLASLSLGALPGAGSHPIASLTLDHGIEQTLTALGDLLPASDFTPDVLSALARRYRNGATVSSAFAGWIEDLLGHQGLVVYDAADPAAKQPVADLFASEFRSSARTCQLVRDAGALLKQCGHQPQVDPSLDTINLFYLDEHGRRSIKLRDGHAIIGDTITRSISEMASEASAHPERFSPNVILRPLVQDRLFPTVCYVAGPSELAYQAQLGGVYKEFGVEPPLLYSRGSATLLDSAAAKFLERHDVAFEALQAQDESVLNRLLERQLPPSIERTFGDAEQQMAERTRALREVVTSVDPTLVGAVDTTFDKVKDTLRHLHTKIVQASKKKDDTLRRQFVRTRGLIFPGGQPQERVLSLVFFANRYGLHFADRLLDVLPEDTGRHYLLMV